MNANNSPSNANTNIAGGNCNAVKKYISPRLLDLSMKRQVQSLADDGERNNAKKRCQDHQPTVQAIAKERVGCGAFGNPAIGAAGQQ